ncbi:MAG: hypothetical protein EON59_00900 [Alphaproteobacteria bacterium]|nr:MAG: hypothetical protein EON59_00900 [Alphaproteobacteria bacterium]
MNLSVRQYLYRQAKGRHLLFWPEHPLLLRGPQALFAENANLCAFFSPLAAERSNPAHLAARLIESKLALPSECRMILILGGDIPTDFALDLGRDFNLIVQERDASLGTFIRDRMDRGVSKAADKEVKLIASARFGAALLTSQRTFREARVQSRKIGMRADVWTPSIQGDRSEVRSGKFLYRPQNRFEFNGDSFSILKSSQRNGLSRQLRGAVDASVLEGWQLDEGALYPVPARTNFAVAVHGLELLQAREKLVTASAFAGVAITPTVDATTIAFAQRYSVTAREQSSTTSTSDFL